MEQQRLRMLPKVPVPARLEDLRGPVEGPVTLPLRLDWSTTKTYDLSDVVMKHTMYAIVLREAKMVDDITALLDGATLGALWKSLRLPGRVRRAWEVSFPSLKQG